MKRSDLMTSIVLVPIDYLMLVLAGLTSYALRYQEFVTQFRPVFFDYPLSDFIPVLLVISLLGVLIFALGGSYKVQSRIRFSEVFSKSFFGVSTTLLFVIVLIFLQRELFSSRFIIIFAWLIAVLYVTVGRIVVFKFKQRILAHGKGNHYVALIGENRSTEEIKNYYQKNPQLGYRVVKVFSHFDSEDRSEAARLADNHKLDELLDVRTTLDKELLVDLLNFAHEHAITFRYVAHAQQTQMINFETDSVGGYPVIQINKSPLQGWGQVVKRVSDILISSIMLILLSPVMVLIAVWIRSTSEGPAFVKLKRVGRGGKSFTLYKFRSMINNSHQLKYDTEFREKLNERNDGPLFKTQNDPRVTPTGKILRKTSLDELPQLLNVLMGDMSLVGPRPHEPEEVAQYEKEYRTLLGTRPGITGLPQVSGRSNLLFSDEVTLDMFYVENWSVKLDLIILIKTLFVVFKTKDAS